MAEVMTRGRQRIRLRGAVEGDGDLRLITSTASPRLKPGDVITVRARVQPPLPQLLPGGFDFTAHAHRQGYVATGFIDELAVTDAVDPPLVARLRHGVQARLYAHLDEAPAAVASAVLIGLRGGITPDLREKFRGSGLAHLLAISGLHMALFWGSVVAVIRAGLALFPMFSSRHSSLKLATLAASPFGLFYLILSGMPISAIRAFLMLALVMVAILLTRRGFTLHHVALVAMGILLVAPGSMFLPAFQMSFAAVFALVAGWMAILRSGWSTRSAPKLLRYLGGIMAGSLLASLASAPFVLHHFGVTTLWSILANIIGMPLMGMVVIPFGALALGMMPFGLEGLPLAVMSWGLEGLIIASGFFSTLPLARLAVPPPSGEVLILITAMMITLVVGRPWPMIFRLGLPALCLMVALGVWVTTPRPFITMTSLHGRVVAVVWRRHALSEACRKSALVLSMVSADYPCRDETPLIDRDDIARHGGVTITREGDEVIITPVKGQPLRMPRGGIDD